MKTTFEFVQHPHSKLHLLMKVTTARGNVYACASAWEPGDSNEKPFRPQAVQYAWKHARHLFLPYDESTGRYV